MSYAQKRGLPRRNRRGMATVAVMLGLAAFTFVAGQHLQSEARERREARAHELATVVLAQAGALDHWASAEATALLASLTSGQSRLLSSSERSALITRETLPPFIPQVIMDWQVDLLVSRPTNAALPWGLVVITPQNTYARGLAPLLTKVLSERIDGITGSSEQSSGHDARALAQAASMTLDPDSIVIFANQLSNLDDRRVLRRAFAGRSGNQFKAPLNLTGQNITNAGTAVGSDLVATDITSTALSIQQGSFTDALTINQVSSQGPLTVGTMSASAATLAEITSASMLTAQSTTPSGQVNIAGRLDISSTLTTARALANERFASPSMEAPIAELVRLLPGTLNSTNLNVAENVFAERANLTSLVATGGCSGC
jgi:hypothetical protein